MNLSGPKKKTVAFATARVSVSVIMAAVMALSIPMGCDTSDPSPLPVTAPEMDQQVRRLREDTEIELRDLRGRWLAAEGMLTKMTDTLSKAHSTQELLIKRVDARLAQMEVRLGAMEAEVDGLKRLSKSPSEMNDELDRLARSYEEIHCLRKRGLETRVGSVYRKYGFDNVEKWSAAWSRAARDMEFERLVNARVQALCP